MINTRMDSRIVQALEQSLELGEVGIQVAAYLGDELIVDASAGVADPDTGRPVDSSTLFCPFSVTKGVTATALHLQAERGLVDYEAPIAAYWPAFATNGKDKITVRQALSHQAGIPWMPDGVTPELQADWDWMIRSIEQMKPVVEPGTSCYHALSWGWIIGEIVRRTDAKDRGFDEFVREELLNPLGITDLYFGLPASEDGRVAKLVGEEIPDEPILPNFFLGMPREVHPAPSVYNTEIARRTVNPGAGALTNASSMARFFALLANRGKLGGKRLLSEDRMMSFLTPRKDSDAIDLYLQSKFAFSEAGFYLSDKEGPGVIPVIPSNRQIIYSPGAGSSIAWAEMDTGLSVSICHNNMRGLMNPEGHPFTPIVEAIRSVAYELRGDK